MTRPPTQSNPMSYRIFPLMNFRFIAKRVITDRQTCWLPPGKILWGFFLDIKNQTILHGH